MNSILNGKSFGDIPDCKDGKIKWGHDISLKTINVLRILLGWGNDINMKAIKVAQIHELAEQLT